MIDLLRDCSNMIFIVLVHTMISACIIASDNIEIFLRISTVENCKYFLIGLCSPYFTIALNNFVQDGANTLRTFKIRNPISSYINMFREFTIIDLNCIFLRHVSYAAREVAKVCS